MILTDKDLLFIENNWTKVPLRVLGIKYNMGELELIKILRQKGILAEIQPIELQYIKENSDRIPAKFICETLGLTNTQFQQIMEKNLN
jgi:hypothetical protein